MVLTRYKQMPEAALELNEEHPVDSGTYMEPTLSLTNLRETLMDT